MENETTTVARAETQAAPAAGASDPFESARLPGNEETPEATQAQPEVVAETEAQPEVKPETETPEAIEAAAKTDAEPAKEVQAKVWAEQYKTPEELETAHKKLAINFAHSSKEGSRLNVALKEVQANAQKEIDALKDQLAEAKMVAEIGPEIKEPSDEELEAMGPVKATRLLTKIAEQKRLLADVKTRNEFRSKESKANADLRYNKIVEKAQVMRTAKDEKGELVFPDFVELQPVMDELMSLEPGVTGHDNSPEILHLAAYGKRALERDRMSKAKTKESEGAAALKAKAAGVGAGAAGAAGGGAKQPEVKAKVDADSDEAHVERLLKAHRRHVVEL